MDDLLSLPSLILLVGVIALAASIIIVAVWVFKLNDRVSSLTRMLMLEQRRTQEIARRIGIRVPKQASSANNEEPESRGRSGRVRRQSQNVQKGERDRQRTRQPQTRQPQSQLQYHEPEVMDIDPQQQYMQHMQNPVSHPTLPYEMQDYSSMVVDPIIDQIEHEPRLRTAANINHDRQMQGGRRPSPQAQRATSAMRASFENASEAIRAQAYTDSSWLETHESRFENRRARQQNAIRRREERQQAQLRRQAEEIVQNHMRQIEEVRDYQQPIPDIPEARRAIYGDYGIPNANDLRY